MQFHLRHLFLATALAALVAFAIADPFVGVPFGLVAAPAAWRWFHWIGDGLPHFTAADRAIEIGFALFVSLIVELVLITWAGIAAIATWLSIVIAVFLWARFDSYVWPPGVYVAVLPAVAVYLATYVCIYRLTMRR